MEDLDLYQTSKEPDWDKRDASIIHVVRGYCNSKNQRKPYIEKQEEWR